MVELNLFACRNVRIRTFGEAELSFLPFAIVFDNGPPQASGLHVFAIWRQILVLESSELSILFKQMFVHIGVIVVFPFPDRSDFSIGVLDLEEKLTISILHALDAARQEFMSDSNRLPAVIASLTGRIDHLEPLLSSTFRIANHSVFFNPHGGRQNQIG